MDTLGHWVYSLYDEVDSMWSNHPELDCGYSIFYSPVKAAPELMLIGLQPGGGPDSFDRSKAKVLPSVHEYMVEDYPIAKKMRDLFSKIDRKTLLAQSVKLNLNFFRSPSTEEWLKIDKDLRLQIAEFCNDKIASIVTKLRPKAILAEGISVFEALCDLLNIDSSKAERVVSDSNKTLMMIDRGSTPSLAGIVHPTGAFGISARDWEIVSAKLSEWLNVNKV